MACHDHLTICREAGTASTRQWQSALARHVKQIFLELGLDAKSRLPKSVSGPGPRHWRNLTPATSGPSCQRSSGSSALLA